VPVSSLAPTLIADDPVTGTGLGLHPVMTGLKNVYDTGKLAVIQGVGFAGSPRSHADAADAWFAGDPMGFDGTGWTGRWADASFDPATTASLGFALSASPALAGETTATLSARSLESLVLPDDPAFPDRPARRLVWEAIYAADATDSALTARIRAHGASVVANTDLAEAVELDWDSALADGASDLHRQLHHMVSIVRHDELLPAEASGWRVFHLTQPGYATHANQGGASPDGKHATKLAELSDALERLWTDLVALDVQDRVLVLVYSEFGRRVAQSSGSGDAGTDNGAAGPVLALGGMVMGGVYGRLPALTAPDPLGALVPHTDFRQVYATVLERFLGADPDALLPGGPFPLVPFLPV
jgi:uncharacterized protein (DUF1501 family)